MLLIGPSVLNAHFEDGHDVLVRGDTLIMGPFTDVSVSSAWVLAQMKLMGKLIHAHQSSILLDSEYRTNLMKFLRQSVPQGVSGEYPPYQRVYLPLIVQMHKIVESVQEPQQVVIRTIRTYARSILRERYNLSAGASDTLALSKLSDEIYADGLSVETGGLFYTFFYEQFGIELPTSNDPDIPDSWVSDTPV